MILSLSIVSVTLAQDDMFICESETDGDGLFTYSITGADDVWYWEIGGSASIEMQSYSVEWASGPDGWLSTIYEGGYVTWQYTNGWWAVRDVPLILQVKSSIGAWTNYSSNSSGYYPAGVVSGSVTDGVFGFVGYNSFEHMGPIRVPRIKSLAASSSELNFSIENMVGSTCHVERATSLIDPDWRPVASFEVVGSFTDYIHALPSNTVNRAFFRLRFEE